MIEEGRRRGGVESRGGRRGRCPLLRWRMLRGVWGLWVSGEVAHGGGLSRGAFGVGGGGERIDAGESGGGVSRVSWKCDRAGRYETVFFETY